MPSSSCTRASPTAISAPPAATSRPVRVLALRSQRAPRTRALRLSGPTRCTGDRAVHAPMPTPAPPPERKPRVLVAGGGIGGLVFALAARRKGFEVLVLERDVSAVRGEGRYRGPIQLQSNALAVLEAVDMPAADEIMDAGCVTGNRVNGIVDGVTGSWYIKFDTFTPAAERGLPVTRVVSRMLLQEILARAVGDDAIMNDCHVVDFTDDGDKVTAILEDGRKFEGDLLVGADGIRSKVRKSLFGETDASYSEYTCYTGIADFVPPDIDTVGYRVFLGHKQYFVSSDVGAGKMQWYAFHKEPAGGTDPENGKKKRLLELFSGWCDNVIDLLNATDEEAILRRDIYDRPPTINWGKGRVTLLGDSVHAMQPNLGQGGCMAIEDGYQLAVELEKAWQESVKSRTPVDVVSSLRSYEKERRLRVAIIHGLARMAAIMATTYRPYLGVGLGPLSVSEIHATITCKNKAFYLTDLGSEHGTWFNDNEGRRYRLPPNFPVRFHPSDAIEFGSDKKAMFRVKVLNTLPYESARGGGEVLQAA
ncbi:hypothetical protein ACQ4PT_023648 [Festuca glaucescens]